MEADTDMDMEDIADHMVEDIIAARIAGGMGVVHTEGILDMEGMGGTHITGR